MSQGVSFLTVAPDEEGQRLDNYLRSRLKGVPKSLIYRVIRKGQLRINKGRVKPDRKLVAGDVIRVPPIRVATREEPAPLGGELKSVLHRAIIVDETEYMAINKPSGLAVHGGSGVTLGLIEGLRQAFPQYPYLELVHRLDRDTSGCILVAKKRSTLKYLQSLFRGDKKIKKNYLALVKGRWPSRKHVVDAPLLRYETQSGERMVKVNIEGKPSRTEFAVVEQFTDEATLVSAYPVTGRTHQIRVHAKHAGYPLAGDPKYGNEEFNSRFEGKGLRRLFLHAESLVFKDALGVKQIIEAPLPKELEKVLTSLKSVT